MVEYKFICPKCGKEVTGTTQEGLQDIVCQFCGYLFENIVITKENQKEVWGPVKLAKTRWM